MHRLSFRPLAKDDIQNIIDYYDLINPKLADAFLLELEDSILHIKSRPEAFQKRFGEIRLVFLKFKFGVFYKMYEEKIVVIAILHTSRDPMIWKKR
ncbi:type II toxin-antitoxin system RelE/ParE family toxin [Gelidibacter maritimus]|uniref:Type II toxin-antitoxin system RelE/ParE family toxin n=1 Tax=Gelidibacter maritimus TaxID=2761487 RepID=A0A7W2M3H3_9FLAO|nr:type II toxin-antitoxin system RelE/ParE family toxin [Gelidibacter maritimus]MBA6151982.1 type II toxin-antitoxin system RelE/ParE family toxin [Gelidibacter maritimus]